MMLLDKGSLARRFEMSLGMPAKKPRLTKMGCANDFNCAHDERRFNADLAYVMTSIDALTCCMPIKQALTDERVRRMLLALEGFATPYLKSRFKKEASQVANRKNPAMESHIRSRRPKRQHFHDAVYRQPARKPAGDASRFVTPQWVDGLLVMPLPGVDMRRVASATQRPVVQALQLRL
ncbi:MAG TPA: hypothetical protein VEF76_14320 [Patescibacteria group bacterium]|nr:hypothetical protein [Patescibacteria group bacterium]